MENDKLRAENASIREAMMHQVCGGCAHPSSAILRGSASRQEEEEDLRVQNASLRAELSRFCALASKLLGKSISLLAPQPMPGECVGSLPSSATVANSTVTAFTAGSGCSSMATTKAGIDKSVLMKLAASAMDELVKMAHMDEPLWTPGVPLPGSLAKDTLNHEEYLNIFSPCITGARPAGFVSEASRESGIVISGSSAALVETLMDEVCPPLTTMPLPSYILYV
jgi:homeobox-leucine zipper protein